MSEISEPLERAERVDTPFPKNIPAEMPQATAREVLVWRIIERMYEWLDAREIARRSLEELARFLDVDRAVFARIVEEEDLVEVVHQYHKPDVPPVQPRYRLSDYAPIVEAVRRVGVLAFHDVEAHPLAQPVLSLYRAANARAILYATILREDQLQAVLWFTMTGRPRTWSAEEIELVRVVSYQVGLALRHAELYQQARRLEAQYRSIFENAVVGIYQSTPQGRILVANPALARMLGYDSVEELLQVDIERDLYVDASERRRNMEVLHRTGRLNGVEFALRRRDGGHIFVQEYARAVTDEEGKVLYYEGMLVDVTERHRLQQQLLYAQRLESVGTLAAGIAHNFNNLLTVILGYASLLLARIQPDDPARQPLQAIEEAAQRAAELTSQLLLFSRPSTAPPTLVKVNDVVENLMRLLRGSFDASISIRTELAPNLRPVRINPAHLEQALMNLCVNARDAMPQGGLLTLRTGNVILSPDHPRVRAGEAFAGEYVVIWVSDTGVGIAPEQIPRIFDPFYTTKEVGKGTGLGLSLVYGIVKNAGGFIDVESQLGRGTTFALYLPVASEVLASEVSEEPSCARPLILLVDDEPAVRRVATLILTRHGYDVIMASDGAEALEIYRERQREIALVILDVTMPRMGGFMCYERLVQMNPQMKVVLCSGYDVDNLGTRLPEHPHVRFLQKPYRIEELLQAVSSLLGELSRPVA
ncbi:MAG: response regulator [Blastocatellia bacterium]|nr:response regulator [Blastocatellia bacterium]MCS7158422.1 response regulator [Blastocatellia bacterium]MCX7752928.1 response regulator [Blastocatellia bacterium]MDW8167984.1 response regulator [Acidobacteriota bacterium]MDW8256359.1 response regulator [Acidobacteriota bacterium]